jgi:hypothetical protein
MRKEIRTQYRPDADANAEVAKWMHLALWHTRLKDWNAGGLTQLFLLHVVIAAFCKSLSIKVHFMRLVIFTGIRIHCIVFFYMAPFGIGKNY